MEILIHEALIAILDTSTGIMVPSNSIPAFSELENTVLLAKIKKALSMEKRTGIVDGEEKFNELLYTYETGHLTELADRLVQPYFDLKTQEGVYESTDLIFVDFRADEQDYLLILDNLLKTCTTHNTLYEDEIPATRLIEYKAVLPKEIGKDDRFVLYDYRSRIISVHEAGSGKNLMGEGLFQIAAEPTPTEVYKVMEKSVRELSEKYEMPLEETIPEFKNLLVECDLLEPEMIAEQIFEKSPTAQQEFKAVIHNEGIREASIPKETIRLTKKDRTMKFVTENGIEVIIPANFLKRKDKVEIITNPDGTSSIEIKNITQLMNK